MAADLQAWLDADIREQLAPLRKECAGKLAKVPLRSLRHGTRWLRFDVVDRDGRFDVTVIAVSGGPLDRILLRLLHHAALPTSPADAAAALAEAGINAFWAVKSGVLRMLAEAWDAARGSCHSLPAFALWRDGDMQDRDLYDLVRNRWAE